MKPSYKQLRVYLIAVLIMAGIWGASFAVSALVSYGGGGGAHWILGSTSGEVIVCRWLTVPGRPSVTDGFKYYFGLPDPDREALKMLPGIHMLGFFAHHSGRGSTLGWGTVVIVPYWPIAVVVMGVIVWVKLRIKRRADRVQGFPVKF